METSSTVPLPLTQRILDNLNTTVCLLDAELRIRYINPAGENLIGISAARLQQTPIHTLFGSEKLMEDIHQALETGHPYTERECELTLTNGRWATIDLTAIPLAAAPSQESELLLELNQVDRQLRIAREENLLAQNQATRALIRGLAHEIKNPLGGLRGAAQLLEREVAEPHLREYTEVITHETDRLRNLVNRMIGPNAVPEKRPLNIHEVVERVRTLVQAEAPPGVRIIRDYDPSLPDMAGDADMLIQATLNIVRNAAQAIGREGEIILRTRSARQYTIGHVRHRLVLCLDVIDNGPGIPEDMVDNIFYPMITGRPDGTGLGLSIAQSLVNQHEGLIECESRPGRTKFSILLPILNEAKT